MEAATVDLDPTVPVCKKDILQNLEFRRLKREIRPLILIVQHGPLSHLEKDIFAEHSIDDDQALADDQAVENLRTLLEELKVKVESQKILEQELFDKVIANRDYIYKEENLTYEFTNARVGIVEALKNLYREQNTAIDNRRKWIEKAILEMREELQVIWKQCMITDADSANFPDFYRNDFGEELLESHKLELELWKTHHTRFVDLLKQIEKRSACWSKMKELQAKSEDPKRFVNRGATLLKSEKEMTGAVSALLKVEEKLVSMSANFEVNGRKLLVSGQDLPGLIKHDWKVFEEGIRERGLRPPLLRSQIEHGGWATLRKHAAQNKGQLRGSLSLPDISGKINKGKPGVLPSTSRCNTPAMAAVVDRITIRNKRGCRFCKDENTAIH